MQQAGHCSLARALCGVPGAGQRRGRLSAQGEGISCAVFGAGACRGVAARHGVQVLSVCNRTCNCGVPQSCGRSARGLGWRRATWWPRGWCGRGGAGRGRAGCSSRCRVGGVRKSGPHALFTPFGATWYTCMWPLHFTAVASLEVSPSPTKTGSRETWQGLARLVTSAGVAYRD